MKFKIRPTESECKSCIETAIAFNYECMCHYCNLTEYTMLKLEKDYVYYIDGQDLKKVHMNYVVVVE